MSICIQKYVTNVLVQENKNVDLLLTILAKLIQSTFNKLLVRNIRIQLLKILFIDLFYYIISNYIWNNILIIILTIFKESNSPPI